MIYFEHKIAFVEHQTQHPSLIRYKYLMDITV